MLDRLRIVKRPEGEPTFHVFYQMLAGLEAQLRSAHCAHHCISETLCVCVCVRVCVFVCVYVYVPEASRSLSGFQK